MNLLEEIKTLGVDVDEGKERLMGNVSLYERMLIKFADMVKSTAVQPDFDRSDFADVTEKVHSLKGAAGNLSIVPLYEAYAEIVDLLRDNQPEQAKAVLEKIMPVQAQIVGCIERHREQ